MLKLNPPAELFTPQGGPLHVLVLGGEEYLARDLIFTALDAAQAARPIALLVHAGAPGAEVLATQWADARGVAAMVRSGDAALKGIDACISFPGNLDTAEATRRAEAAGVPVWRPYGAGWREKDPPARMPVRRGASRTRKR